MGEIAGMGEVEISEQALGHLTRPSQNSVEPHEIHTQIPYVNQAEASLGLVGWDVEASQRCASKLLFHIDLTVGRTPIAVFR